ncbi:MAG TPA: Ig-like domain-containing protein, partial [Polyangiales bacterium]|nr:Ig-like domain-containing protein [Polyangiales bacterium]
MQPVVSIYLIAVVCSLAGAACSGDQHVKPLSPKPHDAGGREPMSGLGDAGDNPGLIDASNVAPIEDASAPQTTLVIEPASDRIVVEATTPDAVQFMASLSGGAQSEVPVRWSSDHPELGSIDAKSGKFEPTGAAGSLTITAKAGSLTTTRTIRIEVALKLEGDPDSGSMSGGAGGLGGVGGEGGGSKLAAGALRDALNAAPIDDAELRWLYPYDGTVWPRGLPAPLLQWQHGAHAALAVKLHIEVEPSFRADLYLGPPPGAPVGQPIVRLPIPQAVWRNALLSGTRMKVELTVAASDGAGGYAAYRAKQNPTWTIAPTTLRGIVYYNSYGTKLAENFGGAKGGNGRFGGATLAIQRDAFDPKLIAGGTTNDASGCRVCHVVSADGSLLIAQHDDNMVSSAYDLRDMNKERGFAAADRGKFGWAALSPDGTIALGNAGPPGSNPQNQTSLAASALYKVSDGSVIATQGLSDFVTQAATPVFSPDGKKVAFNLWSGAGNGSIAANGGSLVAMDVDLASAH